MTSFDNRLDYFQTFINISSSFDVSSNVPKRAKTLNDAGTRHLHIKQPNTSALANSASVMQIPIQFDDVVDT